MVCITTFSQIFVTQAMNDCSSFGYLYYLKLPVFKFRDLDPSAGLEQADIAGNAMNNLGIHDSQSWHSHVLH